MMFKKSLVNLDNYFINNHSSLYDNYIIYDLVGLCRSNDYTKLKYDEDNCLLLVSSFYSLDLDNIDYDLLLPDNIKPICINDKLSGPYREYITCSDKNRRRPIWFDDFDGFYNKVKLYNYCVDSQKYIANKLFSSHGIKYNFKRYDE